MPRSTGASTGDRNVCSPSMTRAMNFAQGMARDDEDGKVQSVLNDGTHGLRITPHQNVDVVDKKSDADDSDDGNKDVHCALSFEEASFPRTCVEGDAAGNSKRPWH